MERLIKDKILGNIIIVQILKFMVLGGIATIIDWVIYYVLYNFLSVPPLIANVFSFSISVIYNYIASVSWVFDVDKDKSQKVLFVQFITLSIIGLLLTELFLFIFINKMGVNEMLSKIIATAIVMVFNFVTRKLTLEKNGQ